MIIAFAGEAGVGKDTAANVLVREYGFFPLALAEPLKNIAKDVFDFSHDQLWGPSSSRNAPDPRYTREDGTPLTPRAALQRLGTEWGRWCDPTIWLKLAIRNANKLLEDGAAGVVITDCRFANEVYGLRAAGAKVVRIIRESRPRLASEAASHASENELDALPAEAFDAILNNDASLDTLPVRLSCIMDQLWDMGRTGPTKKITPR